MVDLTTTPFLCVQEAADHLRLRKRTSTTYAAGGQALNSANTAAASSITQ
jgi:hypothetical protein